MRALIQRVKSACVTVEGKIIGQIERRLLVFLGMRLEDHVGQLPFFVDKLTHLRLFSDEAGKMNLSVQDVEGSILLVSQFTLYGNCRSGCRPSFTEALAPAQAEPLYEELIYQLREKMGAARVATGRFGAEMQVELNNDGPVTFLLENP